MEEPTPLTRVGRTFWTVWNYITGAVLRFLRPEAAFIDDNESNLDQECNRQQDVRRSEGDSREGVEEEKQSDLTTASASDSPLPAFALQPCINDISLDPGSGKVHYTVVSTRWNDRHKPEEEEGIEVERLYQTGGEKTLEEEEQKQQQQQQPNYSDDAVSECHRQNGHHSGPDEGNDAVKNSQVVEVEKEVAEDRLSGEEWDSNDLNRVSRSRTEGNGLGFCMASGGGPEEGNFVGVGDRQRQDSGEKDHGDKESLSANSGVWEPEVTGVVSEEVGELTADQCVTSVTVAEVSPLGELLQTNVRGLGSNSDAPGPNQGDVVENEEMLDRVGEQEDELEVVAAQEEIPAEKVCGRATQYAEDAALVEDQHDEARLLEVVNKTSEEGREISVTLKTDPDDKVDYTHAAETRFDIPGDLHFVDLTRYNIQDQRAFGKEEEEVISHHRLGIDPPDIALMMEVESNNGEEMSGALQDGSPETSPGSESRGQNCIAREETREAIPEVWNNGLNRDKNTTQRVRGVADSEETAANSENIVGRQREAGPRLGKERDTKHAGGEGTTADPDTVVRGSVEPGSLADDWVEKGMGESTEQAPGLEDNMGRARPGQSDEASESHKTGREVSGTEGPLFEFSSDREFSGFAEAGSDGAVGSEDGLSSTIWYEDAAVTEQDVTGLCGETLKTADGTMKNESCRDESPGATLSQPEDHVEIEAIDEPTANKMKSMERGQSETEDIGADIPDVMIGKHFANSVSEETSAQCKPVERSEAGVLNLLTGESVESVSSAGVNSELLMEGRWDLSDEQLESRDTGREGSMSGGTSPEPESSTQGTEEHVKELPENAAMDESLPAFGWLNEKEEDLFVMWVETVQSEDRDNTQSETMAMEHQAAVLLLRDTKKNASADEETAEETSAQMKEAEEGEGEEKEKEGQESGSARKEGMWELSDHTSGEESSLGGEVLTLNPVGTSPSEMLAYVQSACAGSFVEESPTGDTSPVQKCPRTSQLAAEISGAARRPGVEATDGAREVSQVQAPLSDSLQEHPMEPDMRQTDPGLLAETDAVVLRERKRASQGKPYVESKGPSHELSLRNKAHSRRSEFIASPVPGLNAEERVKQRYSLPPTSADHFKFGVAILDLTAQKSRIALKNPSVRPPTDPRALLQMPSLEPSPRTPSGPQQASHLAGRPMGGLGVGIKLPGLGAGFPVLKKTQKREEEVNKRESDSEKSETVPGVRNMSPQQTHAERKPKWTPPRHPGFGNPLMSELKGKLKKASEE